MLCEIPTRRMDWLGVAGGGFLGGILHNMRYMEKVGRTFQSWIFETGQIS
jgi:hypothetical protein